jgi:hypothetical protein
VRQAEQAGITKKTTPVRQLAQICRATPRTTVQA